MRAIASVAMLAACSFERGAPAAMSAPAIDGIASDVALGAWGAPVEVAELNSGFGEDDPSLTGDTLEIYFGSRRATGSLGLEDVWRATRATADAAWSPPINVSELNSASSDTTPKVTRDGLTVFFTSMRLGEADIFFASRTSRSAAWTTPMRVNELSTTVGDYAPSPREDLLRLFWCSGAVVTAEELYTATRSAPNQQWGAPTPITELNEPGISECDPTEPHARALYYASNRAGRNDIYRASRAADGAQYEPRVEVIEANVPTAHDRDPWVSADERLMIFSSDRSGFDRLYMMTR